MEEDILIVHGGMPSLFSNRMEELASELEVVVEEGIVDQFKESLETGIPAIKANLEAWHNLNYHLVGSRGYVYQSFKMLGVVRRLEDIAKELPSNAHLLSEAANQLPRTYGFRSSVINFLTEGK